MGKEPPGNQVYFVQRPFCASNTRLLGKSAKRMKHELSFFFNTNPTGAILYPSHRKVSPTWTRDMCTLLWGTRLRTSILENHKLQSIPESRNGLVHLLIIIVETVNILVANLPPRHAVDHLPGWQKLHGSTGGPRRKVWTRTKILSPNIRYFVANQELWRFTHFLEIFGQKKCLLGSKTVFFLARRALLLGIYCIFY